MVPCQYWHVSVSLHLFHCLSLSLRMIVFVHTQKSFIQIRELDYSLHFYFAKDFVDIAVAHSILLLLPCTQTKASIVSDTICLIKMCYVLAEYLSVKNTFVHVYIYMGMCERDYRLYDLFYLRFDVSFTLF